MPLKWLFGLFGQDAPDRPSAYAVLPEGAAESWEERLMVLLAEAGAGDSGRADAAARELRDRVRQMDARQWVRTDGALRSWLRIHDRARSPGWLGGAEDVRALRVPADAEAAVVGLLSAHGSGYVREAAVQRLALVRGGDEMPPLLLRASDWVPQVRRRAADALLARVEPAYMDAWVRWLPLVLRLGGEGRQDVRPLVDAVMGLLRSPEGGPVLMAGLRSPDRVVRRTCFRILEGMWRPWLDFLAEAAVQSDDVVIRRGGVRLVGMLHEEVSLHVVLPDLVRDPLSSVRRDALVLAGEHLPGEAIHWARDALLDRAATVRAAAQRIVQRLEPAEDLAGFYRGEVIAHGARLPAALMGLGETGTPDDDALVRSLLQDEQPRVRAAALRALVGLRGLAGAAAMLLRALADPAPAVSRSAAGMLLTMVWGLDVAELGALSRDSAQAHVRRNALSLLVRREKWESIPWILRALGDRDEHVRHNARSYLTRWQNGFNRAGRQPTSEQLAEMREALEQVADALDPRMLTWLRFAVGLPR